MFLMIVYKPICFSFCLQGLNGINGPSGEQGVPGEKVHYINVVQLMYNIYIFFFFNQNHNVVSSVFECMSDCQLVMFFF